MEDRIIAAILTITAIYIAGHLVAAVIAGNLP